MSAERISGSERPGSPATATALALIRREPMVVAAIVLFLLFAFTSPIDERWEMPQKLRLLELMWGVAYADGRLGDIERHTMWRIADLLHIPQGAYVHARMRAKAAAGIGDED